MDGSTLEMILKDLEGSPGDSTTRNILADWYEDNQEEERSKCLRWMALQGKRPYQGSGEGCSWFNADTIEPGLGDPESDVPEPLYKNLVGGKESANHKTFESFLAAEVALHNAWLTATKDGWKPT